MSTKTEAQLKRKIRALRKSLDECRRLAFSWADTYSEQLPSGRIHPVHQDILDRAKALLEDEP